jgi:cell division protein FtsW (lipid II flippase)
MITENGQSTGITISEGPGYQIQQSIYAIISGGITGRGLGLGTPDYVPLAHSDFILAAILEEFGAIIGVAVLFLFAVLLLRIFRMVALLPASQVFERLLLVGIGAHLFTQVFVMAGGTLNLLPVTGITIPFLSQGGIALLVNLTEIGLVLAILRRLEGVTG